MPPAIDKIGSRLFTWSDQLAYARLTGDVNPLHMDKVRARRTIIGDIAVHGMHSVTWALECLAASPFRPTAIVGLDVRFPKPLHLDEEVSLFVTKVSDSSVHLKAVVGTKTIAQIKIATSPSAPMMPRAEDGTENLLEFSLEEKTQTLEFEKAQECSGKIDFIAATKLFAAQFPQTSMLVDPRILRGLGACSRLVGMICPGSYSVFSRLNVMFSWSSCNDPLSFKTIEADERFLLIRHEVVGSGLQGQIEAFAPPSPPKQMDYQTIASRVQKGEFSGQRALIIGGSRGLGELTAKIIAAGKGGALLTYANGKEDAENVVAEITAAAGKAEAIHFNVQEDNSSFLSKVAKYKPTHLYYFATCQIFRQKNMPFEPDRLAAFLTYYVYAFWDLCHSLSQMPGISRLHVYYPSSVAVIDRPANMTEYAMAKLAGEVLCADMKHMLPNLSVHMQRLPRLLTDQTNIVTQQRLDDPFDILMPIFRSMR